jgi:hypothetical protein
LKAILWAVLLSSISGPVAGQGTVTENGDVPPNTPPPPPAQPWTTVVIYRPELVENVDVGCTIQK